VSGEPYDLFYGDARLSLFENCRVGILTQKIALILDTLGGGQQVGIYGSGADRDADLTHGFANRIEEGMAGILRCQRSATWVACGSALVAARA
jgi:hypothetical protein